VVNQNNNTQSTTYQNAVLTNFVYNLDKSQPLNQGVNTAPPGYVLINIYGDTGATNASVALLGKIDPTTNTVTSFETVVRGTRFSEMNAGTLSDLSTDANILASNPNDPFVTGIDTIAGQINGDIKEGVFFGQNVSLPNGETITVNPDATLAGNTGQSLGGFGAELLQADLGSKYGINVPTQTFAPLNGDSVIAAVDPSWNQQSANAQSYVDMHDPFVGPSAPGGGSTYGGPAAQNIIDTVPDAVDYASLWEHLSPLLPAALVQDVYSIYSNFSVHSPTNFINYFMDPSDPASASPAATIPVVYDSSQLLTDTIQYAIANDEISNLVIGNNGNTLSGTISGINGGGTTNISFDVNNSLGSSAGTQIQTYTSTTTSLIIVNNNGSLGIVSTVVDPNTGAITTNTGTLTDAETTALGSAGSIGSYVGGQLALLFAGNNTITNLATTTAFQTAGQLLASEIDSQNLAGADLSASYIINDFAIGATNAIGGFAGATAGEALFQSLGLSPTLGQVIGTTVGAAVATYAYAELAPELGLATTASTNFISDLSSGLPGLGVSAFEEITGINPATTFGGNTQDAQIGASIGGLIGTVVLSEFPVVGTVVGQFVGGAIGSLFGSAPAPPYMADTLGIVGGQFAITNFNYNSSASAQSQAALNGLAQTVTALLNAELTILGGTVQNPYYKLNMQIDNGEYTDAVSAISDVPVQGGVPQGADYNQALNDAVLMQLAVIQISGGNQNLIATMTNSFLSYNISYQVDAVLNLTQQALISPELGPVTLNGPQSTAFDNGISGALSNIIGVSEETISDLNYDLQAENDYLNYESNKVAFLVGYALRDPTNAIADWNTEFARAALLQRVNVYDLNQGSQTYNYYGANNIGNEGLLILDPAISPSDVSVSRNGNDLILTISLTGAKITIQGAFANLTNTLGQIKFTNSTAATGPTWTSIDLEALLPAGATYSIPLLNIVRIDSTNTTYGNNLSNSDIIAHGDNDTVYITGNNNVVAVTGQNDIAYINGTGNIVHQGNSQTLVISAGSGNTVGNNTVDVSGINSTLTMYNDNETVTINGNNDSLTIDGNNSNVIANGQSNIATINGNGGTTTANGDGATLSVAGGNVTVVANGAGDTVQLNVWGTSSLQAGGAAVSLTNGSIVAINGTLDTLVIGDADGVTVGGGGMSVAMNGGGNNLLLQGDAETLDLASTAAGNTVVLDGNSGTVTVEGTYNSLTINGTLDTITMTGSHNSLAVNGASGNVIQLSGEGNTLATAAAVIVFSDNSGGTVNGGGNTITVGNGDAVTITGDGQTVEVTGSSSTASMLSSYVSATIAGQGNFITFTGNNEAVTIAGNTNKVQILGAASQVSVSGNNQDVQVSGATVTVAANTTLILDGTDHNSTGAPDYGNGNIVNLGTSVALTVTGSNNWVQASSNDSVTFNDQNDGVGATGTGDIVTLTSADDYALMNSGTLNVSAGAQGISLTGGGNDVSIGANANLSVVGSGNTIVCSGTGDTISITGSDNVITLNGGTLTLSGPGPSVATGNVFKVEGFAFDSYTNGEFSTAASASSLQALKATGANSVELVVTQYTPSLTNPTISPTGNTESDASLEQAISQAEADGLSVFLKPQIDPSSGEWRALYDFSDPATFFANYQAFIVHYAEIAQATGVQMLSIGSELQSLTGAQYLPEWTTIINAVRQVYSGELTYASAYSETATVSFWSQLDVIGVNPYEALTTVANPTVAQLEAGWTTTPNPVLNNEAPVTFYQNLAAQYNKQILFTEIGYRSVNGTNTLNGQNGAYNSATYPFYPYQSYQQQSTALEAFFQTFAQYGTSWLAGADLWEWNPNPSNVLTDDFSVQGKPALSVVDAWYGPAAPAASIGGNQLTLTGGDTVIDNTGGNTFVLTGANNSLTVTVSGATVTDNGTNDIIITGGGANLNINGANDTATTGNGSNLGASGNGDIATIGQDSGLALGGVNAVAFTGSNSTVWLENTQETLNAGTSVGVTVNVWSSNDHVTIGANGTVSVTASNDLITTMGAGGDNITAAAGNTIDVLGGNIYDPGVTADDTITMTGGSVEVATNAWADTYGNNNIFVSQGSNAFGVYGNNNTVTGAANSGALVVGSDNTITFAANSSMTLYGSGNQATIGSSGTITDNGTGDRDTIGALGIVNVAGSSDIVSATGIGGAIITAAAGNTIDVLSGNGYDPNVTTDDTITITGGNVDVATNAWADTYGNNNIVVSQGSNAFGVWGNDNTVTGAVNSNAFVGGIGNTITIAANSSLNLYNSDNQATIGGGSTINDTGTGDVTTSTGGSNITISGTDDTATSASGSNIWLNGTDDTGTAGANSTVTIGGSSDHGTIGAGSTISLAGNNDVATLATGDTAYVGGTGELITGSNDTITVAAGASVTVTGSLDTVGGGTGAAITFAANMADTVSGSGVMVNVNTGDSITASGDTFTFAPSATATVTGATNAFDFQALFGKDVITGFVATDQIQMTATDFASWAVLSSHMAQSGSNTVITLDASDTMTLVGVVPSSLTSAMFHFV
jgi:hypothetical protein